jgi:hypothetical protein
LNKPSSRQFPGCSSPRTRYSSNDGKSMFSSRIIANLTAKPTKLSRFDTLTLVPKWGHCNAMLSELSFA